MPKIDFLIQEKETKNHPQENTSTNHLSFQNHSNTESGENDPTDFIKIVHDTMADINIDPMLQNNSVILKDSARK